MSIDTLYGRRMRDLAAFREENGPVTGWPADRFEVYLDLAASARSARWHHLRTAARRVQVVGGLAYAAPLYVLLAVAGVVHGPTWWQLDAHLRRVDCRLAFALVERDRAGDHDFTAAVTRFVDRLTSSVARMTDRLAQI
ncbi:hypothetical protein ACF09E_34705 [Streptomyces sp. NPDC014891]|uniref:hypothetical protein n=1 Tax=Streptomyces sp. NPDC014891 TaxID=3364929 RepID=UPI0036FF9F4E